eukprot:TRINITY_DN5922_c0_g1_i2.p2 TRINITY_DN5922_c0_g1~~TRINITY_DN5922_c0_g1_i2.p2  ORF type:complete len:242 (-),score=51.14 TRINITY_DN5922_c0_g1_i2:62-787(-)
MSEEYPLIEEAEKGHFEEVQRLIRLGESPDTRGKCSGWEASNLTALMVAAYNAHNSIVDFLIAHGACVDTQSSDGYTALIYAARNNHTLTALTLIKHSANLDAQTNQGFTALHFACSMGHSEIVAALLRHGARTDIKDRVGETALNAATRFQTSVSVSLITQHLKRVPEGEAQIEFARQQTNARKSLRYLCVSRSALFVRLGDQEFVSEMASRLPAYLSAEINSFYSSTDIPPPRRRCILL